MSDRGFIALARGILDHPIVGVQKGEPYSRSEAWEWLIFEAAFKPRRYSASGIVVELQRGQLAHSTRYMAQAWRWPETNVRRFLERLKTGAGTGAMIGAESGAGITVITICNYDRFQNPVDEAGAENGAPNGAEIGAKVAQDRRRKEQLNNETKEIPLRGASALADKEVTEKQIYDLGKSMLGKSAGGMITDLRKHCEFDLLAVKNLLDQAAEKSSPREWIAGVLRHTEQPKTPPHILFPDEIYRGLQ